MAFNTIFTHSLRVFIAFLIFHQPLVVMSRSLKHENPQSLNTLFSLEGLSKGQTDKNLHYIRQYLKRFGYLNQNETTLNEDYFDDALESAIKLYQRNYHLKITGKLDFETIKETTLPRCGVPDTGIRFKNINKNDSGHDHKNINVDEADFLTIKDRSLYAFFDGNPKWNTFLLTYSFESAVQPVPQEDLSSVSSQAFAQWAANSQFTFEERGSATDISIGFFVGDHGDGAPFDGKGGVLAHAFAPSAGLLHIDGGETWSLESPTPTDQIDLFWVTLHELGHVLGLAHSADPEAVMFARYTPEAVKRTLTPDDIAGIQALYAEQ
ncbi:metalloendoproteinase 1-MMP [Ziziphus jujuba]|uniref:Metalloendoproteinase 1-MMP n=1 Tax=Ziziphus jujuba TaxID=326968 RepID=A0A6P3ZN86_ZIZJJ|nr:metalloendoproteinase 1-MMP [Ziziphus jujuba]